MIDKFCTFLTNKIRKEMPEIDDERAEVINYGLQNIVGEIPKTFIMLIIAFILGVFKEALITFLLIIPYKGVSGGFHAKTHIGCILTTCIFFCGIPFISKYIEFNVISKYVVILATWIFGMMMIRLYAPADTENVPILSKKVRRKKQILSYITFSLGLLAAGLVQDNLISNILIFANLFQTISITRFIYKITKNRYGYEVYSDASNELG